MSIQKAKQAEALLDEVVGSNYNISADDERTELETALISRLAFESTRLENAEQEVASLEAKILERADQTNLTQQTNLDQAEELNLLRQEYEAAQLKIEQSQEAISLAKQQLAILNAEVQEKDQQILQLEREVGSYASSHSENETVIASLQTELESCSVNSSVDSQEIAKLRIALDSKAKTEDGLKKELGSVRGTLKQQRSAYETLIGQYNSLVAETKKIQAEAKVPGVEACVDLYESRAGLVPEGNLALKKENKLIWFEFENIYRLGLKQQLVFQTEAGEIVEEKDLPEPIGEEKTVISIGQKYLETAFSGQIVEFELVLLNAFDTRNNTSWRGKFRISKETGKLELL